MDEVLIGRDAEAQLEGGQRAAHESAETVTHGFVPPQYGWHSLQHLTRMAHAHGTRAWHKPEKVAVCVCEHYVRSTLGGGGGVASSECYGKSANLPVPGEHLVLGCDVRRSREWVRGPLVDPRDMLQGKASLAVL